jgi:acyl-CoA dehydrogenase
VATEVITGKEQIALAVTEPQGGSDVANLTTSATLTPCGKFYVVNGSKKFITTGMRAKYLYVKACLLIRCFTPFRVAI